MSAPFQDKIRTALEFRRALRFVFESAPKLTIASIALAITLGILPFVNLYLFKLLIDSLTTHVAGHTTAELSRRVIELIALTAGAALLGSLLRNINGAVNESQSQTIIDKVQYTLHTRSSAVDLEYYENPKYQDTLHRAQLEAPFRCSHIVTNISQLALSAMTLVSLLAVLFVTIHAGLVALLVVLAIPSVVVKALFAERMFYVSRENTAAERRASYYNWLLTTDIPAKEIRLFDLGALFRERASNLRAALRTQRTKLATSRALANTVADTISTAAIYIIFGIVALSAVTGAVTVGALVVFFQAFQRGQSALQDLMGAISDCYENNLFLTNFYDFLDIEPKIVDPPKPIAFPSPIKRGLQVKNLSFSYDGSGRDAISNITFDIDTDETIALVGENGSGKSTLIKLLCRLYDPNSGAIEVDGVNINAFKLDNLRQNIGIVFQDYQKYNLSAKENIWIANAAEQPNDARIIDAADLSGAGDVIKSLPDGYDTQLGYIFSGGEELSVGQWQKIALARAFYRPCQILLLDEPTSALDPTSEAAALKAFQTLAKGKIAIIVSHKLSSVRMADRILVMDNGMISEQGTHEQLMRIGGIYARLYMSQASAYSEQLT